MIIAAETFPNAAGKGLEGFPDPIAAAVAAGAGVGTVSIQRFSVTMSNVEGSKSHTLSPGIDLDRTLLSFRGVDMQASETLPESYMVMVSIDTGGGTVTFRRFGAGTALEAFATVMEFPAGSVSTERILIDIASGSTSGTDTITAVDTARSIIIPNGIRVHGSTQDAQVFSPWMVLTNSTTITAFRNTSGTQLTVRGTILEFL